MKLKTKLIPFASAAAVCATVAPITLTSCGNNSFVDLVNGYTPSYARLSNADGKTVMDEITATNEMNTLFTEHPEYFTEEYLWSTSNTIQTLNKLKGITKIIDITAQNKIVGNKKLQILYDLQFNVSQDKISDLHITTKDIHVKFSDPTIAEDFTISLPVASFTLEYKRQINGIDVAELLHTTNNASKVSDLSPDSWVDNVDMSIEGKQVYTNIPFVVCQYDFINDGGGETLAWTIMPFIQLVSGDFDRFIKSLDSEAIITPFTSEWSIDTSYTLTRKGTHSDISGDYVIDDAESIELKIDESWLRSSNQQTFGLSLISSMLVTAINTSYYLYEVGYKKGIISDLWNHVK